jgi:hypothetical protein
MLGWRPVYGHPAGPSENAWFIVTADGHAFPTVHHPAGEAWTLPWFSVRDPFVFRAEGHPEGTSAAPNFEIIGSFLYLSAPDPLAPSGPWYQTTRAVGGTDL